MLLVPTGTENLLLGCCHVSSPLFVYCCLHTVAAEPVQQLMSMNCRWVSTAGPLLGLPSVVLLAVSRGPKRRARHQARKLGEAKACFTLATLVNGAIATASFCRRLSSRLGWEQPETGRSPASDARKSRRPCRTGGFATTRNSVPGRCRAMAKLSRTLTTHMRSARISGCVASAHSKMIRTPRSASLRSCTGSMAVTRSKSSAHWTGRE